jgi:hypothetical protein
MRSESRSNDSDFKSHGNDRAPPTLPCRRFQRPAPGPPSDHRRSSADSDIRRKVRPGQPGRAPPAALLAVSLASDSEVARRRKRAARAQKGPRLRGTGTAAPPGASGRGRSPRGLAAGGVAGRGAAGDAGGTGSWRPTLRGRCG